MADEQNSNANSTSNNKNNDKTIVRYLLDLYGTHATATSNSNGGTFPLCINRAQAQHLVSSGAVKVNGEVCTAFSISIGDNDSVTVDPAALNKLREQVRVWICNKPVNCDCNLVESDATSLIHILKHKLPEEFVAVPSQQEQEAKQQQQQQQQNLLSTRGNKRSVFPVGRLDKDSCGLLLLTNFGPLGERALHPSFVHEKVYRVRIGRPLQDIPDRFWQLMREGVSWDADGARQTSLPCRVEPQQHHEHEGESGGTTFEITLTQGLNRQIRRMCEAAGRQVLKEQQIAKSVKESGYVVISLKRERFGPIALADFECPEGEVLELRGDARNRFLNWAFSSSRGEETAAATSSGRRQRED